MINVQELERNQSVVAGSIIADSFADDPVNLWIFRNSAGMQRYYTLAAKKLYLPRGYGHIVADDGCSLWLPPGVRKHIALWNSLDIAAAMIRHSGGSSIVRGSAVDAGLARRHPLEPHHYLFAIGARPSKQGKGVGGRLMDAGLQKVDLDGLPAYLESSKEHNIAFYRRYGFEVIEEYVPAAGSPPLWRMWREAR